METLLDLLRESPQGLSGEEASRRLGISRAAIWKQINRLREEGYQVEARPGVGYRLVDSPDCISPQEINPLLQTRWIGREISYHPVLDSTNDLAKLLARQGAKAGTVVLAEEQTQGRGRRGRGWVSPPRAGLLCSIILRPTWPPGQVAALTHLAAWAARQAILSETGLSAGIKWPNDLLIHGKKVTGILSEMAADQEAVEWAVVGIGINVHVDSFPPEAGVAGSLSWWSTVSRKHLLCCLLLCLEEGIERIESQGWDWLWQEVRSASLILGRLVQVQSREGELVGEAVEIRPDGALVLRVQGNEHVVWAGDVSLRLKEDEPSV